MNKSQLNQKLKILLEEIDKSNIIESLIQIPSYPDDPRFYLYRAALNSIKNVSDGDEVEITASGYSFTSPELALLKCLVETIERFSTVSYRESEFKLSSFNDLEYSALDPFVYTSEEQIRLKKLFWIKGQDLLKENETYLPAQTIFFNFNHKNREPHLTTHISSGAAGGFDYESTILRGIYEIIERDAFMNIYLAKIKAPLIDIDNLNNTEIKEIISKIRRYNLEILVFDVTNDLQIPSFLGMIIDRTGLGPSVSLGLKSSLSKKTAIQGCIEESFLTRPWMRDEMFTHKKNEFAIKAKNLVSIRDRGLFWMSPKMIKQLSFFFEQTPRKIELNKSGYEPKEELKNVKAILKNKDFNSYYVDITSELFKSVGCRVFKVIIPKLQPVFFHEKYPEIKLKRLSQISSFFNVKKLEINKIPHPFL